MSVLSEAESASLANHPPPTPLTERSLRNFDAANTEVPVALGLKLGAMAESASDARASVGSQALGEPRSPLTQVFDWGAQRELALKARLDAAAGIMPTESPGVRLREAAEDSEIPTPPRFVPAAGSWKRGTFGPMTSSSASTSAAGSDKQSGESDPTLVSQLEQTTPEASPIDPNSLMSPVSPDSAYSNSGETAPHFPSASTSRLVAGMLSPLPESPVDRTALLSPVSVDSAYSHSAETAIHFTESNTSLPPAFLSTLPEASSIWVTTPAITLTDPSSSTAMLAHTASRRRAPQFKPSLQPVYADVGHGRAESTGRYPVAYHHGSIGGQIVRERDGSGGSGASTPASDAPEVATIAERTRRRWSGGSRQWRVVE
ncbi:uncharacterized protein LOC62_04G006091 [Vanrija pseudolonga]|uniref:Uncharacterized protein n=1 Tax=Vanrija pseudolonga TaxID=143232 RepID=A0AAF0YD46_9TREE|nr:hypothetical protein LOC62_04G006091 [Vanrija pseudolonga]